MQNFKEICDQWQECENDEINNYRKQFGENPTSFKTFAWGYTRATQNIVKILKSVIEENKLLYLEDSVSEFADEMAFELEKKLKETGVMEEN